MPGAAPPGGHRPADKLPLAERRERTAALARRGWSYDRIVREGGLGHNNKTTVHNDVKAVLAEAVKRMDLAGDQLLAARLEEIRMAAEVFAEVMGKQHLAHSNGRVVRREVELPDGTIEWHDVYDDGPRIAAAAQFLRASESLRKLLGQDAPAKVQQQVDSTVSYQVNVTSEEMDQL